VRAAATRLALPMSTAQRWVRMEAAASVLMAELTSSLITELTSHGSTAMTELTSEMLLAGVVREQRCGRVDVAKEREAQGREISRVLPAELTQHGQRPKERAVVAW
jgi:hypothetical protein